MASRKKIKQQEEAELKKTEAAIALAERQETEAPDPNQEYLRIAEGYRSAYLETRETAKLVRAARKLGDRESEDAYRARLKELRPKRTPLRKKLGIGDPAEICLSWDKDGIYSESARAKDFILANYYMTGEIDQSVWNKNGIVLGTKEDDHFEHRSTDDAVKLYRQTKYKIILNKERGVCRGQYAIRSVYRHTLDGKSLNECGEEQNARYGCWHDQGLDRVKDLDTATEYMHKLRDCSNKVRVKIQGKRS